MADKEVYFSRGGGYTKKQLIKTRSVKYELANEFASLTAGDIDKVYEDQVASWEKVHNSSFYYYTYAELEGTTSDESWESRPGTDSKYVALFQGNAYNVGHEISNTQEALLDIYQRYEKSTDFVSFGNALLGRSTQLVEGYSRIHAAPVSIHPGLLNFLSPQQRIQFKKRVEEIGGIRPDSYEETLRRYIPRWMHHPIDFNKENFSKSEWEKLQKEITATQESDIKILGQKDDIQNGKLPIHMILRKAEQFEELGEEELGYKVRTLSTIELLKMEQEKLTMKEHSELPLFHVILSSLTSTRARALPNNAYFDFVGSYHETFTKTYARVQKELENDTPGVAFSFLESLQSMMPDGFEIPLNRSIVEHGLHSQDFDSIALIRLLSEKKPEWTQYFMEIVGDMPERITYTGTEIEEQTSLLKIDDSKNEPPPLSEALKIDQLLEISRQLSRLGVFVDRGKASIEIAIDPATKRVGGFISLNRRNIIRHIPFLIDLSQDKEMLSTDSIDDSQISEDTIRKLKNIVAFTIKSETEKPNPQNTQKNLSNTPKPKQETQVAPRLTRQQRIEEYERRKKEEELAKKEAFQTKDPSPKFQEEKITGLTRSKIELFLNDGGITSLSTDEFIQKLAQALASSQSKKEPLGTKIETDEFGREYKKIDLRELILTVDKSSSVSVYLKGGAAGTLTLEGAFYKRAGTITRTRIQRVLSSILQNK